MAAAYFPHRRFNPAPALLAVAGVALLLWALRGAPEDEMSVAVSSLRAEVVSMGYAWEEAARDLPAIPVESVPALPMSRHARLDHPERISVAQILAVLSMGACHPRREYLGCEGGTVQIEACRVSGMWWVLVIGLRDPPAIASRIEMTTHNLERLARSHHCYPGVEYP